jgi:flagellar hook-basal body complex protein FliE
MMSLTPLASLERLSRPPTPAQEYSTTSPAPAGQVGFEGVIGQLLGGAGRAEANAGQAIQALAAGEVDDVHSVSIAVAQADLSVRMAIEVRNKLLDAYQEVIRLQV